MTNLQIITIDPGLAIAAVTPSPMGTNTTTNLPSPLGPNTLHFDSSLTQATDPPTRAWNPQISHRAVLAVPKQIQRTQQQTKLQLPKFPK